MMQSARVHPPLFFLCAGAAADYDGSHSTIAVVGSMASKSMGMPK